MTFRAALAPRSGRALRIRRFAGKTPGR